MEENGTTARPFPELLALLLAGWRQRGFLLIVTGIVLTATIVYSFWVTPVYTAEVTILPEIGSASNSLLGNLASIVGPSVGSEGSFELVYGQILKSDRILDQAFAKDWRHSAFAEPVSLYQIFGVEGADGPDSALAVDELKQRLRSTVISFRRDKANGYMVLKVNAPRDGAFAADLANFLVDRLDQFNRESQSRIATEHHAFVAARLAEVEANLRSSEMELTDFQKNNRAYAVSPDLMQSYGEINREVQANTAIWVELRRKVELAAIEMVKQQTSVNVLDCATPPVTKSKPRRPLYWAAGLLIGSAAAVVLAFLRHQVRVIRRLTTG